MIWKPILLIFFSFIASDWQTPQLKLPGEPKSEPLPPELAENEVQVILKERNPKRHVDATLKISDIHLKSAFKQAEASEYTLVEEEVGLYVALIVYADNYTRKLPEAQAKDWATCLKKIEQAIFKQTRPIEGLLGELPFDYRESLKAKTDQVKKIRLRALNDALGSGQPFIKSLED